MKKIRRSGKIFAGSAIILFMKTFRAILSVAAVVAFCASGVSRAADESPPVADSVRSASAQDEARFGDNRLATLGDIRHTEAKISELRAEMNEMGRELRAAMNQMLYTLLAAMVALFGLPHLPSWWGRLRENGKPAAALGIFLIVLAVAGAGAAIAVAI